MGGVCLPLGNGNSQQKLFMYMVLLVVIEDVWKYVLQ